MENGVWSCWLSQSAPDFDTFKNNRFYKKNQTNEINTERSGKETEKDWDKDRRSDVEEDLENILILPFDLNQLKRFT